MTMMFLLAFLLARNIIKLWVERRRAVPFARFRAKLVAALLAMTLIPAVLVLLVGSELIRSSAQRWFSAPIDDVLTSATEIAREYYRSRELVVIDHAQRIAQELSSVDLSVANIDQIRELVTPEVTARHLGSIDVYRVVVPEGDDSRFLVEPLVEVATPTGPQEYSRAAAERLAEQVAAGGDDSPQVGALGGGAEVVRVATAIRHQDGQGVAGVVVASDALTGSVAFHSRRVNGAYEAYSQLRALRRPLAGVYLSFFVMLTLLILISATWLGVYVARRITQPVQLLADGAREIGAGHLDHRIEPQSEDEFGSLVEAFNAMAGELSVSRHGLESSRKELESKSLEIDRRRQYIEAILERIATGVMSIDSDGRVSTINRSASQLLRLDRSVKGQTATSVFERQDLQPLAEVLVSAGSGNDDQIAREVALGPEGHEIHLAVAATTLPTEADGVDGTVMVFDDVTPLIRAQRVATWRDVARRLAHEIKNPLTPIQLCAERVRRHFTQAAPASRALVDECTKTIVGEVERLKALVDEFSQFARMPSPRLARADLNALLSDTLGIYKGLFLNIAVEQSLSTSLPNIRIDPEQIRRVVINLVDNAVDALEQDIKTNNNDRKGVIGVQTEHEDRAGVVRLIVRDNGPGIAQEDIGKLFMPYFSTKRRGSGLGLAIVRRIIIEHGGSINVGANIPRGTTFTVELPC
jgi:two-component system nitrogen regulation sensor histidine kinase NtrY